MTATTPPRPSRYSPERMLPPAYAAARQQAADEARQVAEEGRPWRLVRTWQQNMFAGQFGRPKAVTLCLWEHPDSGGTITMLQDDGPPEPVKPKPCPPRHTAPPLAWEDNHWDADVRKARRQAKAAIEARRRNPSTPQPVVTFTEFINARVEAEQSAKDVTPLNATELRQLRQLAARAGLDR